MTGDFVCNMCSKHFKSHKTLTQHNRDVQTLCYHLGDLFHRRPLLDVLHDQRVKHLLLDVLHDHLVKHLLLDALHDHLLIRFGSAMPS